MRPKIRATPAYTRPQTSAASRTGRRSGTKTVQAQWSPWIGHVCADADDGFKHLQAHVAAAAFDSNDNVDAAKCHPNTREAVLDDIVNWITIQTAVRIQWILWLNGAAGAGKSAIARSIVARCLSLGIPVARFFFFRTDSNRNNLNHVVATLVHQLMQSIPELQPIIIPRIQADSLIFTKSLETQFETLIFEPLLQVQSECSGQQKPVTLLFDGLDECMGHDEQAKLIRIITNFIRRQAFPMIAFLGSRAENQLCAEFRAPALSQILLQLQLDTDYRADEDIRRFLDDSFAMIKHTHPLRSELCDRTWPARADVDKILQKASGQFIYASVVIRFISTANQDPVAQLEIVLGLRPSGRLTPFAELDALYLHILSQVTDFEATSLVLAWKMFTLIRNGDLSLARLWDWRLHIACGTMTCTEIKVALAALTSVLTYTNQDHIEFLHASLPDFLLNKKRSQRFYIDRVTFSTLLSTVALRRITTSTPSKLKMDYPETDRRTILPSNSTPWEFGSMVESYLAFATPTPELKELVTVLRPDLDWESIRFYALQEPVIYIQIISKWDFGDGVGGRVYREQREAMRQFVCRAYGVTAGQYFQGESKIRVGRRSFWDRLKSRLWRRDRRVH